MPPRRRRSRQTIGSLQSLIIEKKMKGFIEDDFLFGSFFTYLERAIADFFCTLSAAESSAGLKC